MNVMKRSAVRKRKDISGLIQSRTIKDKLQKFWNSSEDYWEILGTEKCLDAPSRKRALEFIPSGSLVLDAGCGRAANAKELRDRGCHYVGLDISLTGLLKARNDLGSSVNLTCGDAESLPFRNGVFDAVVATFVLEYSTDPRRLLSEMHRSVRPEGIIVLLGPSWDFPWWFPNAIKSRCQSARYRFYYSVRRLYGQLKGWLLGHLPFEIIDYPDCLRGQFVHDADAVYIVWAYEVVEFLCGHLGCRLVHWEVDDRLLGNRWFARFLKRLLLKLSPYQYAGSTLLLVFEKR